MKLLRYGSPGQEKPGLLDRDGKIVAREFGLQSRSVFVDNIKKALSQGRSVQAQK